MVGAGCIQHLGGQTHNPLELGYRLRRDRWGQGLASEAARALAGFAFETLAAPELTAICHPKNTSSARVMLRLGMHYRGVEHWHDQDVDVYGMSRTDWLQRA